MFGLWGKHMFGLWSKQEKAAHAAKMTELISSQSERLEAAEARVARHSAALAQGCSDPAAERYFLRVAEGHAWVHRANLQDFQQPRP